MIQLREDIAWVRDAAGRLAPFDNVRLAASIQNAVATAGLAEHLLAESIASAIHLYTTDTCRQQTIAASEIAELVNAVLTMLDLDEIARAYEQRRQFAEIRLDRLTESADFELGFYRRLDSELTAVVDDDLELVQLRGLRACVMRLRGARRWGESCRVLADEIIGFVRERVRQVSRAGTLYVEVME
ncbi:MAG: hypothetical protein PCFJNLEI_01789 [Verrucomicrobiae bacterium]|nr:hypothetical protein [Verrucomicrobiae bacterium]